MLGARGTYCDTDIHADSKEYILKIYACCKFIQTHSQYKSTYAFKDICTKRTLNAEADGDQQI